MDPLHRSADRMLLLSLWSWSIRRLLGRPGRCFQQLFGEVTEWQIDMTLEHLVGWRVFTELGNMAKDRMNFGGVRHWIETRLVNARPLSF